MSIVTPAIGLLKVAVILVLLDTPSAASRGVVDVTNGATIAVPVVPPPGLPEALELSSDPPPQPATSPVSTKEVSHTNRLE